VCQRFTARRGRADLDNHRELLFQGCRGPSAGRAPNSSMLALIRGTARTPVVAPTLPALLTGGAANAASTPRALKTTVFRVVRAAAGPKPRHGPLDLQPRWAPLADTQSESKLPSMSRGVGRVGLPTLESVAQTPLDCTFGPKTETTTKSG